MFLQVKETTSWVFPATLKKEVRPLKNPNATVSADYCLHIMCWSDVGFLISHIGLPLARTRLGTLELSEDERRLKMRASFDMSDSYVRAIIPKIKRGHPDEMSFNLFQSGKNGMIQKKESNFLS